jgi:hypothetical protein
MLLQHVHVAKMLLQHVHVSKMLLRKNGFCVSGPSYTYFFSGGRFWTGCEAASTSS